MGCKLIPAGYSTAARGRFTRFLMLRADNFVIMRRKAMEGYDISFLLTNFNLEARTRRAHARARAVGARSSRRRPRLPRAAGQRPLSRPRRCGSPS